MKPDVRGRGFEWFVAWRYLRDPERRSFLPLKIGGVMVVLAALLILAAALVEGRLFGSGGFLRLRASIIADNLRLAAVIVFTISLFPLTSGAWRALSFSVYTSSSLLCVTVGVYLPIVTLSVMSGFETDLKTKIRGAKADVVISRADDSPFNDWEAV